jgi:hypothetical protein
MANVKIGDLSATGSVVSTDGFLPIVGTAADVTYKISVKNLANALPQVTSSLSASYAPGSIFVGTNQAASASYVLSASYALSASFARTSSYAVTSSYTVTSSYAVSASFALSSNSSITASYIATASYVTGSVFTLSNPALSSSYSVSSSLAATANSVNTLVQNVTITGSLVVSGANGAGIFSQGATLIDYSTGGGISNSGSYMVWRAPFSCSVVALYGYREGGGQAQVNAARSGSSGFAFLTGSNLVLTAGNVWSSSLNITGSAANFNAGDSLKLIMSGSSANNQLAVQVDFIRKF